MAAPQSAAGPGPRRRAPLPLIGQGAARAGRGAGCEGLRAVGRGRRTGSALPGVLGGSGLRMKLRVPAVMARPRAHRVPFAPISARSPFRRRTAM